MTVVIPTRNRWRLLRSALWSVLGQRGVDVVAVVVDDASEDGTAERLREAADPRVTVLRQPVQQGVSRARNRGLGHVETPWVAFLDDDDVWAPDHLAGALRTAREQPDATVVCAGSLGVDLDRQVLDADDAPAADTVARDLVRRNVLGTPSRVLARTEAVREVGGFAADLAVVADWDLYLRLIRTGPVASVPGHSVGYTRHPENMSLRTDITIAELPVLEARHPAASRAQLTDHCAAWIGDTYRRSGRRVEAARWYLRSARRTGVPRDALRAAGALLGERVVEASGMRRAPQPPPTGGEWLRAVREVDALDPAVLPWPVLQT